MKYDRKLFSAYCALFNPKALGRLLGLFDRKLSVEWRVYCNLCWKNICSFLNYSQKTFVINALSVFAKHMDMNHCAW